MTNNKRKLFPASAAAKYSMTSKFSFITSSRGATTKYEMIIVKTNENHFVECFIETF